MKYCYQMSTMSLRGGRSPRRSNPQLTRRLLSAIALAMTLFITSCTALDVLNATPIPILLTETPLPTSTFVWFPASETSSPQPFFTYAPTPEMRPGLGATFLTDEFSDKSLWDVATS